MNGLRVFVVEDDPWYVYLLNEHLSTNPAYEIESFSTGEDCIRNLYKNPSVITVDYTLPDMKGKELLQSILSHNPETSVIIISGQKDVKTALGLLKDGAYDYIVKDEDTFDRLNISLRIIHENLKLKVEIEKLKREVERKYTHTESIIGNSPCIRDAFTLINKASTTTINVSISGETGTGKEIIAKSIHYNSNRKNKPFVEINFSTIPKDMIENELFGYEKGAFTGAHSRKTGLFEEADKGTIFLDEIAEMDLDMQTKLLRVLQEKEIKRLGSNEIIKVDVRVISSSHRNLIDEVHEGRFRADLFYRLMGLQIHLQPLRERGNDIILLATHFADVYCKENGRKGVTFDEETFGKLMSYHYPGNVRELKAIVELSVILSDNSVILPEHINFSPVTDHSKLLEEDLTLNGYIVKIIKHHLKKNNNNPTATAKALGVSRATIYNYIKNYNI